MFFVSRLQKDVVTTYKFYNLLLQKSDSLIDYIFSGNSTKEANKYIMQTTHSFPIQSIIMQYNMTQYNYCN